MSEKGRRCLVVTTSAIILVGGAGGAGRADGQAGWVVGSADAAGFDIAVVASTA